MSTTPNGAAWRKAIGVAVAATAAICLVVLAFMWPGKTSEAKNLPITVAGPQASVSAVEKQLAENGGKAIAVVHAESRDQAVEQIRRHESYGAIVVGEAPAMPEILTAPAAGAAPTQMLQGLATQMQAQVTAGMQTQLEALGEQAAKAEASGDAKAAAAARQAIAKGQAAAAEAKVTVTPVVPLSQDDPNGAGLAAAAFPLALGGMIGGMLISLSIRGAARRLTAVGLYSSFTGLALAGIMQGWFHYLQGNYWLNAAAIALAAGATAAFIVGLNALIGKAGLALGAIVTVLLGNPLAGAAAPWQFLAEPWGAIGQYLVPGASNALIRLLSYFPDANTGQQWWTLAAWALGGAAMILIGGAMHRGKHDADGQEKVPARHVPARPPRG